MPPLHGEKMWPQGEGFPVLPPPAKKMPRRPKKKRNKNPLEEKHPKNPTKLRKHGTPMTCSNCNKQGHNRKGCKSEEVIRAPKPKVIINVSINYVLSLVVHY